MTKLTDLRKGFASGMERGYISSDDWRDEVLPMLEDAERYRWLRSSDRMPDETRMIFDIDDWRLDSAIDKARNTTNEG